MKRFKSYNKTKNIKALKIFIVLIIMINTFFLLIYFGEKTSNNIYQVTSFLIENYITNKVNDNVQTKYLKEFNINNLITIKYDNNKITNVDYNLEEAYKLMIEVKNNIKKDLININQGNLPYATHLINNNLVIELPIYNYTNNFLITNISPKIRVKIDLIQNINGNVITKIKNYGINTSLVELYITFNIKSNVIIPFLKKGVNNNYEILLTSKVIQGKIPLFYNGIFESKSSNISS